MCARLTGVLPIPLGALERFGGEGALVSVVALHLQRRSLVEAQRAGLFAAVGPLMRVVEVALGGGFDAG